MNINEKSLKHLDSKYDTLHLLTTKLKHLQLCKIDYDNNLALAKKHKKQNPTTITYKDEYYQLQAHRHIIEIFTIFSTLRELLKERFYTTVGNGKLQPSFYELHKEHEKIRSQTLKKNRNLIRFASILRNEFIHNDLHRINFITFMEKINNPTGKISSFCDTFLVLKLNNLDETSPLWKIANELLHKYLYDPHIKILRNGIYKYGFDQNFMDELTIRASIAPSVTPDLIKYNKELENINKSYHTPSASTQLKNHAILTLFTNLAHNPDFVNCYLKLKDFISTKPKNKKIYIGNNPKNYEIETPNSYFNFSDAFDDAYQVFYSYYTQLHTLILNSFIVTLSSNEMKDKSVKAYINTFKYDISQFSI